MILCSPPPNWYWGSQLLEHPSFFFFPNPSFDGSKYNSHKTTWRWSMQTEWTSRLNHNFVISLLLLYSCIDIVVSVASININQRNSVYQKLHYPVQDFNCIYIWAKSPGTEVNWGQLSRTSTLPPSRLPRPQTHYILLTQPSLRHLVGSTAEGFVLLCWASCSGERGSNSRPWLQTKKANKKRSHRGSPRPIQSNPSLDW